MYKVDRNTITTKFESLPASVRNFPMTMNDNQARELISVLRSGNYPAWLVCALTEVAVKSIMISQ